MKSNWLARLSAIVTLTLAAILALWVIPKSQTSVFAGPAPDASPQTYFLFVFDNPVAGRDAEYNQWMDSQHIPEMLGVPGFADAQRLAYSDDQMTLEALRVSRGPRNSDFIARAKRPTKYGMMYRIVTTNLPSVYDEIIRREKNETIKISQALDKASEYSYTFRVIAPMIEGKIPAATDVKPESYYVFVYNTPLPGREDEYNAWYNSEHGPGIVRAQLPVAGSAYASGQRMALDETQLNGQPVINKYLVLYKLITPDVATVFKLGQQRIAAQAANTQARAARSFPYDETTDFNMTYKIIGPVIASKHSVN